MEDRYPWLPWLGSFTPSLEAGQRKKVIGGMTDKRDGERLGTETLIVVFRFPLEDRRYPWAP